jgi:hypothetical protein
MIDYPPDLPAAARGAIERALADAEDEFIAASAGAGPVTTGVLGEITYPGMWDRSDRAAVSYVLTVFATVVQASCDAAREGHWSAEKLRTTSQELLAQLLGLAYRQKHSQRDRGLSPFTLDDFTTVVHRELRALTVWTTLHETIRELATSDARPRESTTGDSGASDTSIAATETETDLRNRRARLLEDYKRATSVRADKQIYENKKAGIHKPQFYQWRSGKLPATSETARNFERFLAEKQGRAGG